MKKDMMRSKDLMLVDYGDRKFKNESSNYQEREINLAAIGFKNYSEYLASSLWKRIRGQLLSLSNKCVLCKENASCIHHTKYTIATLTGEDRSGLYPLCYKCHYKVEFTNKNIKRTYNQALDIFRKMYSKVKNTKKKKHK